MDLDLLRRFLEEPEAPPSAVQEERFGILAVQRGFISSARLQERIEEQQRRRKLGEDLRLGQILLHRGDLSVAQVIEVLHLQNRTLLTCGHCKKTYTIIGPPGEAAIRCLKCGSELPAPGDPASPPQPSARMTPYRTGTFAPGALCLGKYRLIREVARGGMGVVYEAEDPDLNRRVALKTLIEGEAGIAVVKRLHQEASLAARLQHPNIIAIHEVGAVRDPKGRLSRVRSPTTARRSASISRSRRPTRTSATCGPQEAISTPPSKSTTARSKSTGMQSRLAGRPAARDLLTGCGAREERGHPAEPALRAGGAVRSARPTDRR